MTSPLLETGSPQPPGASRSGRGINFAVFSQHATRVELCLFDASGLNEVARLALPGRTGDIWHGFLPARFGESGLLYGYRVHGPYQPGDGHRFNPAKLLIDPCAQALHGELTWHPALNGAEPVSTGTLERFARRFAPCGFRREAIQSVRDFLSAKAIARGDKTNPGRFKTTTSAYPSGRGRARKLRRTPRTTICVGWPPVCRLAKASASGGTAPT